MLAPRVWYRRRAGWIVRPLEMERCAADGLDVKSNAEACQLIIWTFYPQAAICVDDATSLLHLARASNMMLA